MPLRRFSEKTRGRLLTAWVVVFTALVVFALAGNRQRSHENQERITDIQQARVASCRQTYEGVREVFKPFLPAPPRSKETQDRLDLFNDTVDDLKAQCSKQIQTKEVP